MGVGTKTPSPMPVMNIQFEPVTLNSFHVDASSVNVKTMVGLGG